MEPHRGAHVSVQRGEDCLRSELGMHSCTYVCTNSNQGVGQKRDYWCMYMALEKDAHLCRNYQRGLSRHGDLFGHAYMH